MKAVLILSKSADGIQPNVLRRELLTWTTDHPASSYGKGVLLDRRSHILEGEDFRVLRNIFGATIETDDPEKVCRALGLPVDEPGVFLALPENSLHFLEWVKEMFR